MTLAYPTVVPDYMKDVRAFLRVQPNLLALHGGRVYFRAPEPNRTGFPYVRIYLINEVPMDLYSPDLQVRIGLHVWGNVDSMATAVRVLMNAISSVIWNLDNGLLIPGGQTYVYSAQMVSNMDLPDPASGWPRRTASSMWFLRMAGASDSG